MARWPDGWIVTGTAGRIGDKDHGRFIADARNTTTYDTIHRRPAIKVRRAHQRSAALDWRRVVESAHYNSCDPRQLWIKLHIDQIAKSCILIKLNGSFAPAFHDLQFAAQG
jgi:hypothetical protein